MNAWIVWPVVVPLAAATLSVLAGQRMARVIIGSATVAIVGALAGLTLQVWQNGPQRHVIGGWEPPLGIQLYADGLSVVMLWMSTVVGALIGVYALGYFAHDSGTTGTAATGEHGDNSELFWPLWLFLWAALHALFLSADIFNLYVTLELLGLAGVALVNLAGGQLALVAGMRYLLASLLGSLAYFLGVAFLYATCGVLDVRMLSTRVSAHPAVWLAIAVMTLGLLLKTALFPLHFWLPPAHANAPAPVSALLSALVVKASFYLLLRLWFQVFSVVLPPVAGQVLGILGVLAILWGSVLALRQQRLKLLVAYSTVAQIGYLFVLFPLAGGTAWGAAAWSGGTFHALAHACAKAAMFMAAGTMMAALGHDHLHELAGMGQRLPLSMFAFALAGVSLMGLPPSGGFVAKWLLLDAALASGQWWWGAVLIVGGLLAAGYVFLVLRQAFAPLPADVRYRPVPRVMELAALSLALLAFLLGLMAIPPLTLLQIGAPFVGGLGTEALP
ncbi:MAG: oxidoreductase [Candidatus Binatia bacterium]|nr:oxidoreductase [Candidatus Binatia bacterium]